MDQPLPSDLGPATGATIVAVATAPPAGPLPEATGDDLIILPVDRTTDGRGIYHDSALTVVKELRALGVSAHYQDEPERRTWSGQKGFAVIALDFLVGIASNAGWRGLERLLAGRYGSSPVRVRVGFLSQSRAGLTSGWYEIEGTGDEVVKVLTQLRESGTGENPSGPETKPIE